MQHPFILAAPNNESFLYLVYFGPRLYYTLALCDASLATGIKKLVPSFLKKCVGLSGHGTFLHFDLTRLITLQSIHC